MNTINTDIPLKRSWLEQIYHALAVFVGFFRRPGRFSAYNYRRKFLINDISNTENDTIIDLGCGTRRLSKKVFAVDLIMGHFVDVVANAEFLPFHAKCCDGVWMDAILEHVENPDALLAETNRVLKSGGWVYAAVPFLQGYHPTPGDYRRWTPEGLKQLFNGWDIVSIDISSGPFSALAYQLRSCLSIITSFGSDFLYRILFEAFWGYVVWPIKFMDIFFRRNPRSMGHAFGYSVLAHKRNDTTSGSSIYKEKK